MNNTDILNEKIGDLVAQDYRRAEVFKKHGLDFCCGGGKTIAAACADNHIDENALIKDLQAVENNDTGHTPDFNSWDLDFLVDYIVNTHHQYVVKNIPLILEFSEKVARVHGHANPEVIQIFQHFKALGGELSLHMRKEEHILFPFIKMLASARKNNTTPPPAPFGTVANPISMMEHEHDNAGSLLKEICTLSNNHTPPDHACNTYRVLYAKLKEFEADLHQHIHLENNILFPKAKLLELKLAG